MSRQSPDNPRRGASVIENTVAILRCFAPDRQELGVTEIAPRVGLHKSSVSRILASLEQEGIVEQAPSRRYRLGLGIIAIAGPLLADLDVRRAAYPILQALTRATSETSALMVWDGAEAVTVEQVPSPEPVKHTSSLGSRYRTEGSASVKVFRDGGDGPDRAGGPAYALNDAETSPHEVGIAAPVHDHRGEVVAAVLIAAPKFRTDATRIAELGEHCVQAAERVSLRLGGSGRSDSESVCDDGTVKRGSSSGWAQRKVARTVLSNSRTCSAARAATVCSSPSRIASSRSMCSRM